MGADLRREIHTTAEQVRTDLRQEIHASAERLRVEVRQDINASAEEVRADFRQEIQAGAAETQRQMQLMQALLLERMEATAAETRRHFGVVAESLRSDIKTVAEGLGALDEKVERFRGEVSQEFAKVDRRLLHLQVRVIDRPDPA